MNAYMPCINHKADVLGIGRDKKRFYNLMNLLCSEILDSSGGAAYYSLSEVLSLVPLYIDYHLKMYSISIMSSTFEFL